MDVKHLTQLSRLMSYALRHRPDAFQLTLDEEGWVSLAELLAALKASDSQWHDLSFEDLRAAPTSSTKQRFEFTEHSVRALYGHSTHDTIKMATSEPPEFLYHGTTPSALDAIRQMGLQPMARQFVHLSPNTETAEIVARRRTDAPVILLVHARKASQRGVLFYHRNADTWLSDAISPSDIEF